MENGLEVKKRWRPEKTPKINGTNYKWVLLDKTENSPKLVQDKNNLLTNSQNYLRKQDYLEYTVWGKTDYEGKSDVLT
jgi:hypothetical protein